MDSSRYTGPEMGPERISELKQELKASRRRREERRRNHIPEFPGKIIDAGQRRWESTQGWVTRFLLGTRKTIDGFVHDDPDSQMRMLASDLEQLSKKIEEYTEAHVRDQTKWQKEGGKIRDEIRKLADKAVDLYQAYVEYPFSDNFEKYGEDKAKAAGDRNNTISFINQSIALHFWNTLKDLEKLTITDKTEFKEALHSLNTLQAKMSDRADLDKAAREFEEQARLAELQIAQSRKRDSEGREHSAYIQHLPDRIGRESYPLRQLKEGNVKDYSEQAEKRVEELKNVLPDVETHLQDTEAKIGAYISQARKRANAFADAQERERVVGRMFIRSGRSAINGAAIRMTNARNRAAENTIGDKRYKDEADAIATNLVVSENPAGTERLINIAKREAQAAERRAKAAERRAKAAEERAKAAEERAKAAEERARIAEAYKDREISDVAAKDVEKHARDSEKWEKEVASNAYLIQANEIKIRNELRSIANNLRLMHVTTVRPELTPKDKRKSLAELVNKVEKAEIAKNSAIAFELQATEKERMAIENARDALQEESTALAQERDNAQRITNLANGVPTPRGIASTTDMAHLQNLVDRQRALKETLTGTPAVEAAPAVLGLIELERNHSHAVRDIELAIQSRQPDIADLKATEHQCRLTVARRRREFQAALRRVSEAERAAAGVLQRNAIHKEGDVTGDAEQAIERLQKIKDNLADQDDEGLKNRSKGHLFIDPKLGKFTIGDEAIWMSVREINDWGPADSATLHPGETHVTYRPDIVKMEIETITREAQGGKLSVESIYTKRLAERYFRSTDFEFSVIIKDKKFANNGRREAVLTITDLKKQDGTTPKPGGGAWTPDEYTTQKRKIPMEAAATIKIKENHNNQSTPVENTFSITIETMPNPVIDHAQALGRRQGEGWSDEDKRRMCKLDLDRRVLILPNGLEFPMDEFDWTETKWDQDNGLTLQYKGPKELSQVNLLATGSSATFDEKLLDATNDLKEQRRKHAEEGIELIKRAIKSNDINKINNVISYIMSSEGVESYQSSMVKNELEQPPKNGLDLERLKKKKSAQRDAQTPKSVTRSMESAAGMLGATQSYGEVVKKHIRTIHENDPLSAEHVWKSHANRGEYALDKHRSSQRKQELRDEIRAANHLDKTVDFQLLVDPKRGPTGENSPVKNAMPNGLELLQEYNLYKNKQDFTDNAAGMIERQYVAQYVANIETEFQTNPNIDPYYANQYYLEKAMDAARDENFLGKEVEGEHVMGVSEYIRKLKQVDCPPSSDKSLAGLRQADEYHWVTYLRNALAEADREGMVELLKQALPLAKQTRECIDSNSKLAEKALDLETPSEEAKKIVDDMHTVEPYSLWPEIGEKPAEVGEDGITKAVRDTMVRAWEKSLSSIKRWFKDDTFNPKAIIKKSDEELALEAGRVAATIYKDAVDSIESLIASTDDPFLQKRYRDDAVKLAMDLAKQAFEIEKQDKSIQNQWQKFEVLIKETNKQRWKDMWKELTLLWLKTSVESGGWGVQRFMSEIMKILTK